MNLRKLILEEIDSLDWVGNVPSRLEVGNCIMRPPTDDSNPGEGIKWTIDNFVTTDNDVDVIVVSAKVYGTRQENKWIVSVVNEMLDNGDMVFCQKNVNESEFDWAEDIGVNPLHVGNYVYIDGSSNEGDSYGHWEDDEYMILKIIGVNDDEVTYVTHKTNIAGEGDTDTQYTEYENAKRLVDTRYWKPYNMKTGLFESEFGWAEETPIPPIHVGGKLQTPNGNILTIYKIEDNMVWWTVFHDGKKQRASDRFDSIEKRIEAGIWNPVSDSVNESDLDWAQEWSNDLPTIGDEYYYDYNMGSGPVLIRVIGVIVGKHVTYVRFKVLDEDFIIGNKEMFYDDEYGWDVTDSISIDGFMEYTQKKGINESEFGWADDVPSWDSRHGKDIYIGSKWTHENDGDGGGHGIMYTITDIGKNQEGVDIVTFTWSTPSGTEYEYAHPDYFDSEYHNIKFHNNVNESEFEWTNDVPDYEVKKGDVYTIPSNESGFSIEVTNIYGYPERTCSVKVFGGDLGEEGIETNQSMDEILDKLNRGFWVKSIITESEFDWTDNVNTGRPVYKWDGGSVRGSNSPMNDQVYIYTDSDGDTHSLKVGGVSYKHRTRKHDGGYFSNDGEISFYDSSITQDEIDLHNQSWENPDPREGKTEINMTRKEFNEFIDQGRLTLAPDYIK